MAKFDKETILKHVKSCFNINPKENTLHVATATLQIFTSYAQARRAAPESKVQTFERASVFAAPATEETPIEEEPKKKSRKKK